MLKDGMYQPVGDLTDLAVPDTLTALISARLDELDARDRGLVSDAAVVGQSFSLAAVAAVAGQDPGALEPRLRGLVRRELLVLQADPRSPERGQYAFVQALIREVAYNKLAKRDRKVRHLAAARFFEGLETDELAGALAGHYLAAHGYASEGPEADALAAQARVALRGAAERAAALGSHQQAIAFLEHALAVSPAAADRADLHERALASATQGLDLEIGPRHALAALEARRELGDRNEVARATAAYAASISEMNVGDPRVLEYLLPAWEEFGDLEATPAGVLLMLQLAGGYVGRQEDATSLLWLERALRVSEQLDLLPQTATGLARLSSTLYRLGRPQEALILLRGAHELAEANGLDRVLRTTRTVLTWYEQFADPVAGLAMAREALELARRRGSTLAGFLMVGNGVSCAIRVGDWDWSWTLLEEWLATEVSGVLRCELYVDRAVLAALRGGDPLDDIDAAERLLTPVSDTQYRSYCQWARAWAALAAGRLAEAREQAELAVQTTSYFVPISLPIGARAALWAGDHDGARDLVTRIGTAVVRGQAFAMDVVTLRAGVAALEGRRSDAVAGYREALRGWRALGLAFDEALAGLDLAILLNPTEREMPESPAVIEAARATFAELGARPFAARLETADIAS